MKKNGKLRKRSQLSLIWHRLRRNKLAMVGLVMMTVIIMLALCADLIADYNKVVVGMNMLERLQPPSAKHWFGTDGYGRDVFARIIHGSRLSLTLSIVSMSIAVAVGSLIGAIAGYYGGKIDDYLMRLMDMLLAIPPMLMSISIVAALGRSMVNLMLALALAYMPVFARVIRSSILSVKGQEFVEAAKACGTSDARIIMRHIVPNAVGPIIVQATLAMGSAILTISSLSFMGMGIQPPQPEWGTMLYEGRDLIRTSPYLVIFPGIAIAVSVLSLNLLGDGLRDALDPRLKN
ncbi:MAG: ABC transporter permease [Clostridia bacterium]|nr:ABC transporter permease [Clostridia bacterium]